MTFPKVDKLILKNTAMQPYLDGFYENSYFTDAIFFKDKDVLCGSFDRHYGVFHVTKCDTSKLQWIPELIISRAESEAKNIYNFPYAARQLLSNDGRDVIAAEYLSNYDIIENRQEGCMICVDDLPETPPHITQLDQWTKHICGKSELTTAEVITVTQWMSAQSNADELFKLYNDNLEKAHLRFLNEISQWQTKNNPVVLWLDGTDDLSYKKCVATTKDALIIYNILKTCGGTEDFYDLIQRLGFKAD